MGSNINETPKGTSLGRKTSYDIQIVKMGPPVRPVRVTKRPKRDYERNQMYSRNLGIRRDHPRRRIKMKFCMVGGLQMIVLGFEFHQNRLSGFGAVGGRNLPIPIDLAIGLYNSLYYCTSHENSDVIGY